MADDSMSRWRKQELHCAPSARACNTCVAEDVKEGSAVRYVGKLLHGLPGRRLMAMLVTYLDESGIHKWVENMLYNPQHSERWPMKQLGARPFRGKYFDAGALQKLLATRPAESDGSKGF